MLRKTLFINFSWSLVYDLIFNILGILFYLLLARSLGKVSLGTYVYIISVFGMVNVALDLGITTHYWRKWAADTSDLLQDIEVLISTKAFLTILVALVVLPFFLLKEPALILYFLLMFMISAVDSFRSVILSYLRSQNIFSKVFFIMAIERVISLGGGIILLLLNQSLFPIFLLMLIGQIVSTIFAGKIISLPKPKVKSVKLLPLLQVGFPIFLIGLLSSSYQKIDSILIRFILGLEMVGQYASAYRILDTLLIFPTIILLVFLPTITTLLSQNNKVQLFSILSKTMSYLFALGGFIGLFFHFYSSEILDFLYGSTYIENARVLQILGWSVIFFFLSAPLYSTIIASKKDQLMIKRLVVLIVFNGIGNFIFLPIFGIQAAAAFTLFTEILGFLSLLTIIRPTIKSFLWVPKIVLVILFFGMLLSYIHPPLFPTLIVSWILYCLLLTVIRVIKFSDFVLDSHTI